MCNHHRIISAPANGSKSILQLRSNFWSRKVFGWVQYHVLNLHHKCNFGPEFYFEFGPKLRIRTIWKWTKIRIWHVYLYPQFMITCQNAVSVHFQTVKWAILVQIRNKTLAQNCDCDVNRTRDTELIQRHFWTKNLTPPRTPENIWTR